MPRLRLTGPVRHQVDGAVWVHIHHIDRCSIVLGSLGELLLGHVKLPEQDERKMIFSPFGLGVLDLAVADLVLEKVIENAGGTTVPSFLP